MNPTFTPAAGPASTYAPIVVRIHVCWRDGCCRRADNAAGLCRPCTDRLRDLKGTR